MSETVQQALPHIVIFNFGLVALVLIGLARTVVRRRLSEVPDAVQNAAEYGLEWFIRQAQAMRPGAAAVIAPFLATLFLFILFCNLLGFLAFPIIRIPPTAYYSGTLTLALIAMIGVSVISARYKGCPGALKDLVWPNPLQLVTKISDTLSLSLRLFGNIGGEFIVSMMVLQAAPYFVPLVIHVLGLIPAVIQPTVFILLTSNFLAEAIHAGEEEGGRRRPADVRPRSPDASESGPDRKGASGSEIGKGGVA